MYVQNTCDGTSVHQTESKVCICDEAENMLCKAQSQTRKKKKMVKMEHSRDVAKTVK